MVEQEITQGDSVEVGFYLRNHLPLAGWTCVMQLRDAETRVIAASVNRSVTVLNDAGTEFVGVITSAETAQLAVGRSYVVAAQLNEASTGASAETDPISLKVVVQWVY